MIYLCFSSIGIFDMEYKFFYGCPQEAVDKGWFRTKPTIEAPPNMPVILATAAEIADAMAFLHAKGVMHGDLTGGARFLPRA